jgi:type IV secretion system protein VirB9
MSRHLIMLLGTTMLVAGCAATEPRPLVRAEATEAPTLEVAIAPDFIPAFKPQLKALPKAGDRAAKPSGLAAIEAANQEARIQAAPDGFINASQLYAFEEGAVYELHAAPSFVSTVLLQPGEQLVNYAAGDTARWIVDEVRKQDQTLLLVKPTRPDLTTNLVITTDKRIYLLEAASHEGDVYNAFIAWTYPLESLSTQVAAIEAENDRRADTVIAGVPVEQLSFDYAIQGDKPRWRPIRAFDDGRKVYIEFPAELATSEAPPLFVTDDGGDNQLVNYRVKNRYYVVDRLFSRAELRLDGTVVTIDKDRGFSGRRFFTSRPDGERRSLRRDSDDHGERGYDRASGGKWG